MQKTRFVRTLLPAVMLGLTGCLVGCSGESAAPVSPEKKEANKRFAADFKDAQRQFQAAKGQAGKDRTRGGGPR